MKYNLNAASLKSVFNNQNISGGCTLTNKLKDSSFLPMFNLEEMKRALEKQKCPVHHQKAQVTLIRRGVEIKTCCNRFDLIMTQEHERQIAIQAENLRNKQTHK